MKKIISILSLILLCSCSNRISPHFESNAYPNDSIFGVTNASLKFSHESYGDVRFIKEKAKLKKHLKTNKVPFDNVLVYGKTFIDPIYEYYILLDSKKNSSFEGFHKDTLIGRHTYTFIGIPLDGYYPKTDFDVLSKRISSE